MSFTSAPTDDRWRDVYLASAARAISTCGDFLAATALVVTLQGRGASGFAVAALFIAAAAPPTLLAPVAGRLADRVDSRRLLVAVSLVEAALCAVLATVSTSAGTLGIVALATGLGCGLAVTGPVLNALLPAMVGRTGLARATAVGQTSNSIGLLLGPALGGLLVGQFGPRVPLLIDAATYLAITLAALLVRTRRGGRSGGVGVTAGRGAGLHRDPLMRAVLVMIGAVVGALTAVNVAEVFFVRGTLHGSATAYGLLGAVWTAAMLAGSWLVVRRPLGDGGFAVALLVSLAGSCVAVLGAATVQHVGWMVPLWAFGGLSNGATNVCGGVLLARRVPAEVRGRAFALFAGVANGASTVGYLLGGALLAVVSARSLLALAGAAGLLVALAFAVPTMRAAARDRPAANRRVALAP